MNSVDEKLVSAVLEKAAKTCPGALALVAVYGSAATGDTHEKSDLDLVILIEDPRGNCLAQCFILEDIDIGYDLYCTSWERMEEEALCEGAHLSRLMDSRVLYCRDEATADRLEALRKKAACILASPVVKKNARTKFETAKEAFSQCFLADSLGEVRFFAAMALVTAMESLMLYHGSYFRRGTKRTFEELATLQLPFDCKAMAMDVVCAPTAPAIREALTAFLRAVHKAMPYVDSKEKPAAENLTGAYEEMYSNWRNKLWEAADREDVYASFVNLAFCQGMYREMAESVELEPMDLLDGFTPEDLHANARQMDAALEAFLVNYERADIVPKRYADADEFCREYLRT